MIKYASINIYTSIANIKTNLLIYQLCLMQFQSQLEVDSVYL